MSASSGSSALMPDRAASMPRPVTLTPPPGVHRTVSGRRHRCASPAAWAPDRASAASATMRAPARVPLRRCHQIGQRVADRPLQHDVGVIPAVLDVEHLRQAGVGQAARSARRGDRLLQPREAGRERDDTDRAGENLVNRLPGRPATGCGEPVLQSVPAAEPHPWL